jgi:phosphatidylinositol alpha-mannosyltransferase
VVATPNVGARYVLDDGRAGVLVELPGIGRALVELLGDSARRERMRAAGLARAREFALSSVVDRYEAIYRGSAS